MNIQSFSPLNDFQKDSIIGFLDLKACIMSLNCNYNDYLEDYNIFRDEVRLVGYMRTFFHELTHFFQLNTTPVGFYLTLLEDYQASQVRNIIKYINNSNLPIIKTLFDNYPSSKYPEPWMHLRRWYIAELMICIFSGDFKRLKELSIPTIFRDSYISELFWELDFDMSRLYKFPLKIKHLGGEAICFEKLYSFIDYPSVFENHARISEFWWDAIDFETFNTRICTSSFYYNGWILEYFKKREIQNISSIVSELIAICEIALFSPILPWTSSLNEKSFFEMIPHYRISKLLYSLPSIKPISDINDYNRFVLELVEISGLTPVDKICKDIMDYPIPERSSSYWIDIFYKSIKHRSENFSVFQNYGLWHPIANEIQPFSIYFTKTFTPPFTCFNDIIREKKIGYGSNSGTQILVRYLYKSFCKQLMIGTKYNNGMQINIRCPIPASEKEKNYLELLTNSYIGEQLLTKYSVKLV